MNTENVSINTFLQWRRDIKENGTVLCSPTTVGLWQEMPLTWNASDRQNEKKHDFFNVKYLNYVKKTVQMFNLLCKYYL